MMFTNLIQRNSPTCSKPDGLEHVPHSGRHRGLFGLVERLHQWRGRGPLGRQHRRGTASLRRQSLRQSRRRSEEKNMDRGRLARRFV